MSGKTCLSANHTPSTNLGAACQTYLSTHHCVLSNLTIVSHLNQVIQLHALVNGSLSHGAAVDTCIGTYLNVILDHYDTNLWNLIVSLAIRCKTKTVGAYHATCVYCNIISNFASLVNGYVGVEQAFLAYLHAITNHGVGINLTAVADNSAIANHGKGSDVHILTNLSLGRDGCQRIDTRLGGFHALVELQQFCYTLIGIFYANQRTAYRVLKFYVFVDEYYARLGVVNVMGIFGVREERNGSLDTLFDLSESADGSILIAFHSSLYQFCNLFGCKLHIVCNV